MVEDVPAPVLEPGSILVRTAYSCISTGTELAALKSASTPLWRRALAQPDKIRMVAGIALSQGPAAALEKVRGKLAEPVALGYSAAGTVLAIGEGVSEFRLGDRVAVAGSQCAYHAEVLCIPRNLAVRVPDDVGLDHAATVALGAIALQGVRRAELTLGERVAVIGLGVLGQLTVQMLKAAGCSVLALDLDPARVALAKQQGADDGLVADIDSVEAVRRRTDGHGVDAVIITAAARSDEIVASAFRMSRRKGRVVLVGDVGLGLQRADIYAKEIDFRVSCSYGPGRYDADYEEHGVDYPLAYVRWTENRNMQEYLRLVQQGNIRLEAMHGGAHALEEAQKVYLALQSQDTMRPIALFAYQGEGRDAACTPPVPAGTAPLHVAGIARIGVVGAGQFTRAIHLPILREEKSLFAIRGIAARTGHKAQAVAREFGAAFAATDADAVVGDAETDAVLISTRHDSHAALALKALIAGKHVLVEKPLALNEPELAAIEAFLAASAAPPILMTGFNRRHSRYAACIRERVANRAGPLMITYRMNAGYIPHEHWVHGVEGGGRNLGEACHVYDLFCFLVGSPVEKVQAMSIAPAGGHYRRDDNFCASVRFADGSVASLAYTAIGAPEYPKEQMEVFCDGKVLFLDDYRSLTASGVSTPLVTSQVSDKGMREQWREFARAMRAGTPTVPFAEQAAATRIALEVQRQLFI